MYNLLDPEGVMAVRTIPPKSGEFSEYPDEIEPAIVEGFKKSGIDKLYTHQREAIELILKGNNTIAVTSTASGKSLIYTIPAFNSILNDNTKKTLYIAPTKALGQDQKKNILENADKINWPVKKPVIETCDGDTPYNKRKAVLNNGNFIITNPDMLHFSILPKHSQYKELYHNLSYIVIDEAHTKKGIFGNHVSNTLLRLRRIAEYYNSSPQLILCTATIENPLNFAKNLTGLDFKAVTKDTAPAGEKQMVFYEPPIYEKDGEEHRRLTHYEAARQLGKLVELGYRGIIFCRSRRVVESTYNKIIQDYPHLHGQIKSYKGTFTPEMRRELERSFFSGEAKGIVSTNALELGIDIGDLDVVIMAGFPGSISSVWQQSGRSGRKGNKSLAVLMAQEDPLDLYLVNKPDYFFAQPCESAIVDPSKFILEHLLMAGYEYPLQEEDKKYWGKENYFKAVQFLKKQELIFKCSDDPVKYMARNKQNFSLRGEMEQFKGIRKNTGEVIEEYDYKSVLNDAYPGAITYSMGQPFLVDKIDYDKNLVIMNDLPPHLYGCYTHPKIEREVEESNEDRKNKEAVVDTRAGVLKVKTQITGYQLIDRSGRKTEHDLPQEVKPMFLKTTGIWLIFSKDESPAAEHVIEHLLHIILPWLSMAERNDIDTHLDKGTLYIFDNYKGGIGISESQLNNINRMLNEAYNMLTSCKCEEGCPTCGVVHPQCNQRNSNLDKNEAIVLLEKLLGYKKTRLNKPHNAEHTGKRKKMDSADLRLAARQFEQQSKGEAF